MARKTAQVYDFGEQHEDTLIRVAAEVESSGSKIVDVLTGKAVVTKTIRKLLAAAGDYAADDVMSESATVGTAWVFPIGIKSGWLEKVVAVCSVTALTPRLTLQFYTEPPTCTLNDNATNTGCIAGDTPKYVGYIDLPAMRDLGTGQSESLATPNSASSNLPLSFTTPLGILYGVVVTRDAITGEAAGMSLSITIHARED